MNSSIRYNLVHKFILMLEAMKIPDAKAAVDKEWEKLEKIPAWQLTNVRNKEVIDSQTTRAITQVLPWYRPVGVANTSSETHGGKWAAREGKWSPRGTGTTVLTYPGMRPGNRQGW